MSANESTRAAEAKKRGMLPVYASHTWQLLAVIKCLTGLQERRREQGKKSKLDGWLSDFVQRLSNLAATMIFTQEDGIVYLRKDDRELLRQLIQWVEVNGLV